MARPRKNDKHLPPCVYQRHGAYWHVRDGKWTRLGAILEDAFIEYARIHEAPRGGMPDLIDTVLEHIRPNLSKATIEQYEGAARKLKRMLQQFAPDQVRPKHVAAIKVALAKTPNMANRCLSFLRQVFAWALEQQLIATNPAVGIKRHLEAKRGRLISMAEYRAIYSKAGPRLQVIMDLLIRTGQRVSDVLHIRRTDLTDEGIRFVQQKTGAKLVVPWTPELRTVVDRTKVHHGNIRALTLLHNRKGKTPDYHAGHSSPAQTERYLRDREKPLAAGPSFGQSNRQN